MKIHKLPDNQGKLYELRPEEDYYDVTATPENLTPNPSPKRRGEPDGKIPRVLAKQYHNAAQAVQKVDRKIDTQRKVKEAVEFIRDADGRWLKVG